jgi:hypothetical protein
MTYFYLSSSKLHFQFWWLSAVENYQVGQLSHPFLGRKYNKTPTAA